MALAHTSWPLSILCLLLLGLAIPVSFRGGDLLAMAGLELSLQERVDLSILQRAVCIDLLVTFRGHAFVHTIQVLHLIQMGTLGGLATVLCLGHFPVC